MCWSNFSSRFRYSKAMMLNFNKITNWSQNSCVYFRGYIPLVRIVFFSNCIRTIFSTRNFFIFFPKLGGILINFLFFERTGDQFWAHGGGLECRKNHHKSQSKQDNIDKSPIPTGRIHSSKLFLQTCAYYNK